MRLDYWRLPRRVFQPLMREVDARGLEPKTLVSQALHVSAEALLVNAGGFSAWYPTKVASQRENRHLSAGFFGDLVAECHASGLKFIARMDISKGYPEWLSTHPDWFVYGKDGSADMVWAMPQTCFTGPVWQQHNFEILDEILSNYPVDGFFYNYYHIVPCHCERCRKDYARITGLEMPEDITRLPEYERYRASALAEYTRQVRDFIHERSEHAVLIPYHHVRDGWDFRSMAGSSDVLTAQASNPLVVNPVNPQPRWNHWDAEETLLARSVKPDVAPLIVNSCSEFFASRQTAIPGDRLARDLYQAAAHGGSTCPAINGTLLQADPRAVPAMVMTGASLKKNECFYQNARSVASIAVLRSEPSILWGRDNGQPAGNRERTGHVAEYRGIYEIVSRLRYQADIVPTGGISLADLKKYKAVIAPSLCCLSAEDAAALDSYVEDGGHLICTGDTGSCDEMAQRRTSPALRSMPKVPSEPRNISGAYLELASSDLRREFDGIPHIGVDGDFYGDGLIPEENRDDDLFIVGPFKNNAPEFSFWDHHGEKPGLVRWCWGNGSVAWLPWRAGALYHSHSIPEYVALFRHLLKPAGEPPMSSTAPGAVEFVLRRHQRGLLVHVINGAAPQGSQIVELTPVAGFQVCIKSTANRAVRLDTGEPIALNRSREGVTFGLDRLDTYALVLLEETN